MKPLLKMYMASLFIILTGTHCSKDKEASLPPETTTGAGTFGCKVDGSAWVPKGTDYPSGTNVIANYQHIYSGPTGYAFSLSARNYDHNPRTAFVLGADSIKLVEGMTIRLLTSRKGTFGAGYWVGNDYKKTFITRDSLDGEIYLKKLDESLQIISGTFWFNAINEYGERIHVTEGRFDVKYTR